MFGSKCLSEKQLWSLTGLNSECPTTSLLAHLEDCVDCRQRFETLQSSLQELDLYFDGNQDSWLESVPLSLTPPQQRLSSPLRSLHTDSGIRCAPQKNPLPESALPDAANKAGEQGEESVDITRLWTSRYRIIKMLSSGGQGRVYLAEDIHLHRKVAIKIANSTISENVFSSEQIIYEGELLVRLNHPQLAQVYDAGVDSGKPYLVMEYIAGRTLSDVLQQQTFTMREIRRIILDIACAVEAIHACGILHLDLKPSNVMMMPDGRCKVVDLGTSWLVDHTGWARENVIGGTIGYISPEQYYGRFTEIGAWTDVFGLGAILFKLLTANQAADAQTGSTGFVGLWTRATPALQSQHVDSNLKQICLKAVATHPCDRFQSIAEFRKSFPHRALRRRAISLMCVGTLLCVLGVITRISPSAPNRNFEWETLSNFELMQALSIAESLLPETFLKISAVNTPDGPVQFCLWSHEGGLQFFPVEREITPSGQLVLKLKSSHEGLKIKSLSETLLVLLVAGEFQDHRGTTTLRVALQDLLLQFQQKMEPPQELDFTDLCSNTFMSLAPRPPLVFAAKMLSKTVLDSVAVHEVELTGSYLASSRSSQHSD